MNCLRQITLLLVLFYTVTVMAQLAITVTPPKVTDQKAVVELKMKNGFAEKVESARAICFLLDERGKMVGQSSKWVIGGTKNRPALETKSETSFNFVITGSQPFTTTNLTAKVSFSRVVLEGEKLADPKTAVQITNTK